MRCEDCHRNPYLQSIAYDNGTIVAGKEAHAAVKPRCLDCHSKTSITLANGSVVSVPFANAFGEANYGSDYSAHKKFVVDALNFNLAVGENEACLSCHAGINLTLTFRYPAYVNWSLSFSTITGWANPVTYTPLDFSLGPETTFTVELSGSEHKLVNVSTISCIACHRNVYLEVTEPM